MTLISHKCKYCSNDFNNISALNAHQKFTKYCIKIQNEMKQNEEISDNFTCYDCSKVLTTKQSLLKHTVSCNAKRVREIKDDEIKQKNLQIIELKIEIERLKNEVEIYKKDHETIREIAKQPRIQNQQNITNLNIFGITSDEIKNQVDKNFNKNHLLDGQKGVAIFTQDNLLKDNYICNDVSRGIFYFKDYDGKIVKDIRATNLTKMIANDVISKSNNIVDEYMNSDNDIKSKLYYQEMLSEVRKLKFNDNKDFARYLAVLTNSKKTNKKIEEEVE